MPSAEPSAPELSQPQHRRPAELAAERPVIVHGYQHARHRLPRGSAATDWHHPPRLGCVSVKVFAMALFLVLAGCGDTYSPETDALERCREKLEERTGQSSSDEQPWRVTSRRDGNRLLVEVWTRTPKGADRPVGDPDLECEVELGTSSDAPARVLSTSQ